MNHFKYSICLCLLNQVVSCSYFYFVDIYVLKKSQTKILYYKRFLHFELPKIITINYYSKKINFQYLIVFNILISHVLTSKNVFIVESYASSSSFNGSLWSTTEYKMVFILQVKVDDILYVTKILYYNYCYNKTFFSLQLLLFIKGQNHLLVHFVPRMY